MTTRKIYDHKQCPSFLQRLIYLEPKVLKVSSFNPRDFAIIFLVPAQFSLMSTQDLEGGEENK